MAFITTKSIYINLEDQYILPINVAELCGEGANSLLAQIITDQDILVVVDGETEDYPELSGVVAGKKYICTGAGPNYISIDETSTSIEIVPSEEYSGSVIINIGTIRK